VPSAKKFIAGSEDKEAASAFDTFMLDAFSTSYQLQQGKDGLLGPQLHQGLGDNLSYIP
jgi:hypothetical protein